jgi:hypothetical protein
MKSLWEVADFVRLAPKRLRFGELSRAPLRLLRLELRGEVAECEWMARAADAWDVHLPAAVAERHAAIQALEDSLSIRQMLFATVPSASRAVLRVFRIGREMRPELIIAGQVTRDAPPEPAVRSVAMRAMSCGFRFSLEDGVLQTLHPDCAASF